MTLDSPVSKYALKETLTINQGEAIAHLITQMQKLRFRRFPVTDDEGHPVGVVTSSDILGVLHEKGDLSFLKDDISSIMSSKIVITEEDATIRSCIGLMYNIGISGLPLVKNNKITGILTEKDLILIDDLWKTIPDRAITAEEGLGRPILDESIVTTDFSFWQVADILFKLPQRQVLVRDETDQFIGQITIMNLLSDLLSTVTLSGKKEESLQTLLVSNMSRRPLFQRGIPMIVSSARLWMNSRGLEAFPIFARGKPVKLITEKDLVGYLAQHAGV